MDEFIGKEYWGDIDIKNSKLTKSDKISIFLGDSVKLHITLKDGDKPKDLTNVKKYKVYYKREDDTLVDQDEGIEVISVVDGQIDIIIPSQVTRVISDKITISLRLLDDDEMITTTSITMRVSKNIDTDISEESKTELSTLEDVELQIVGSKKLVEEVKEDVNKLKDKISEVENNADVLFTGVEDEVIKLEERVKNANDNMNENFDRVTELEKVSVKDKVYFKLPEKSADKWVGRGYLINVSGAIDTTEIINTCEFHIAVCRNINTSNKNVLKLNYESRLDYSLANNRTCGCQALWSLDEVPQETEIAYATTSPIGVLIKTNFNANNMAYCHAYIRNLSIK